MDPLSTATVPLTTVPAAGNAAGSTASAVRAEFVVRVDETHGTIAVVPTAP